jgi:hypothetical protein
MIPTWPRYSLAVALLIPLSLSFTKSPIFTDHLKKTGPESLAEACALGPHYLNLQNVAFMVTPHIENNSMPWHLGRLRLLHLQ